ncbi:hypothetical protein ACEPAH_1246 [Sanghuangporus vaninii]
MAKHFHSALPSYHHEPAQRITDAASSRHPPSAKVRALPRDKTFTKTARRRNRVSDAELLTVVAALATFAGHIPSASAKEVGLGEPRPDVPEFLCPALLTASEPVPPSASATASSSSSSSYPSQTCNSIDCVAHHQQQQQDGDDDDDGVEAFVAPTSDSDENSYQVEAVVRSTFSTASSSSFSLLADYSFIPTHSDRPPSESDQWQRQRQLVLEDVESDSYSNVDNANANTNTNTAFANDNFNTTTSSFRNKATATTNSNSNNNRNSQSRQLKRKKRRRISPNNKRSSDDNDSVDSSSYSSTSPSSTQCTELYTSRTIPDRYELGNDGRWHKLSVSSSCSQCECECQTSIDVDDSADTELSPTGVVNNDTSYEAEDSSSISATSFTSSTPSESDAVAIVVPDGWDRDFNSVVYQVPLIVVASLLLAGAVTGAVWFTFFWRRRQRTAKKLALQRDLEKRKRVEEGNDSVYGDDGGEGDEDAAGRGGGGAASVGRGKRREKTSEEKAKARWARATEQWKAHVRWTHRRRRGRASIVDGMKQRDAAMASGISLAQSIASASSSRSRLPPPPSRENNDAATSISNSDTSGGAARSRSGSRSRSRSRVGSRHVSSEAQPAEGTVVRAEESRLGPDEDGEDEVVAQAGASIAPVSFRTRGTRDRGNGNSVPGEGGASRGGAGALSDGHRSVFVVPQDQNQNLNQNRTRRQSRRRRRRRREQSLEVGEADGGYEEGGEDELDGEVEGPTHSTWTSASRSSRRSRLRPDVDAIAANSNGLSGDCVPNVLSSIVSSVPVVIPAIHDPWAPRGEYDRPPPELCPVERVMAEDDEEVMRQGPPAYRSRRSVDGADVVGAGRRGMRRRRGRRRVRDEKIATAAAAAASTSASGSGCIPSPGDYAPYSSSGETDDGIEEAASGSSRSSSMERSGGVHQQTSMHVAVDDKQALARLATYASAPPPLPSSPPPPPHSPLDPMSFTSSSHPSSSSLHSSQHAPFEPNAPPEPEWERFEDCEYPYKYGRVDSPGAGPGPSTIFALSRSASPSSFSASCRSISRSQQQTHRSPSYSESQSQEQTRSAFPAPPRPISSKLAYAPADAGLVHPHALADTDEYNYSSYSYAYGYGSNDGYGEHDFGLDLDSALERMMQGPSAPPPPPPFSASGAPPPLEYGDVPGAGTVGGGGIPSAPPEDVLLAGASAPPLFEEREDGDEDEVVGYAASAPPLDVVENGDDTGGTHSGNLQDDLPPESPLSSSSSDPDRTVDSADHNGVPCPPR